MLHPSFPISPLPSTARARPPFPSLVTLGTSFGPRPTFQNLSMRNYATIHEFGNTVVALLLRLVLNFSRTARLFGQRSAYSSQPIASSVLIGIAQGGSPTICRCSNGPISVLCPVHATAGNTLLPCRGEGGDQFWSTKRREVGGLELECWNY